MKLGGLVDDDGILLIEACEAGDGHDRVDSVREGVAVHDACGLSGNHRFLRVVQNVRHRVESVAVVGGIDPDGLFSHRRLIGVGETSLANHGRFCAKF